MGVWFSLIVVGALILIPLIGVGVLGLKGLFGVFVPYLALVIFIVGLIRRVIIWGKSPVPFHIPTTCGQMPTSLPWIKHSRLESPANGWEVFLRMFLEVVFFRSLFRNLRTEMGPGQRPVYGSTKWLWLGGIVFHYSFLVVLLRHLRFFTDPTPKLISTIESVDGFFQIGHPHILITGLTLFGAAFYLFLRRVLIPYVKNLSLPADYFPLFLIMAIAGTGILMRYFLKTDIIKVKELTMGLATLHPKVPEEVGTIFYVHLFLVSSLFAYFPFSKLVHLGGVFLSPTRNLANNSRAVRHINPWDYPVKVHTYEEYEEEFREKMKMVGIPVEKDVEEVEQGPETTEQPQTTEETTEEKE
ncbi:MAG: menaquinol oxidoreductase [Nitrospirae bacterium]|nr:MAG: menaquinol oxidoreductase [Nitrospirota bacterium]